MAEFKSDRKDILKKFMNDHKNAVEYLLNQFELFHGKMNTITVEFFRAEKPGEYAKLIENDDTYSKVLSFNFSDQIVKSDTTERFLLVTLE